MIRAYAGAALLVLGAVVLSISLLGVLRFKYVLNRLHAAAIADTLGTLLIIAGLVIVRGVSFASLKLILVLAILWVTGPVCTNRIASVELSADSEYKKHCR